MIDELWAALVSTLDTIEGWLVQFVRLLPHIAVALLALAVFWWIGLVLRRRVRKVLTRRVNEGDPGTTLGPLLSQMVLLGCVLMGVLVAASVLGLDKLFTSVLTSMGVMGIAAGYALKDVAANLFAGIVISIKQPIRIGQLAEVNQHFGVVHDLDLLYTTIRALDGEMVLVPNQEVYAHAIINYSRSGFRRVVLSTGVSYGDDLEDVRQVALDTVNELPGLATDRPIDIYFTEIGGSSYNFELRYWIHFANQPEFLEARSQSIMKLKAAFEAKGISIPYPVQTQDFDVSGGVNLFDKPVRVRSEAAEATVPTRG